MHVCLRLRERERKSKREWKRERGERKTEKREKRTETNFPLAFITSSIMTAMSSTLHKAVFN